MILLAVYFLRTHRIGRLRRDGEGAMAKTLLRDLIVIIPGILGSALEKSGRRIWPIPIRTLVTSWAQLEIANDLTLPSDDPAQDRAPDGMLATEILQDFAVIPGCLKYEGYTPLLRGLRDTFDIAPAREGRAGNLIEFAYDWRRDNRVTARQLALRLESALRAWRESTGLENARLILLAHSMGGLVARYYLEVLGGWKSCRLLVTFGTPHRGSVQILKYLAQGYSVLGLDLSPAVHSFASSYQLLPTYPVIESVTDWLRAAECSEIPRISREKAAEGRRFHDSIVESAKDNARDAAYRSFTQLPVIGTGQPTVQSAHLKDGRLEFRRTPPRAVPEAYGGGDGRVPVVSAIPVDQAEAVGCFVFSPEQHSTLHNDRRTLDNLLLNLRQLQAPGTANIRGGLETATPQSWLSLDLDDVYEEGRTVELKTKLEGDCHDVEAISAHLRSLDGELQQEVSLTRSQSGGWTGELDSLPPGGFEVSISATIHGGRKVPRVRDHFLVVGSS
jgi:pimeloyl-ACP methyl ester carboxylesterase